MKIILALCLMLLTSSLAMAQSNYYADTKGNANTAIAESDNDFFIPSTFSPDGDGVNDVFKVEDTRIKVLELCVFNKMGELVFSSKHQEVGWDGTKNGKKCDSDMYIYTAKILTKANEKHKKSGYIALE